MPEAQKGAEGWRRGLNEQTKALAPAQTERKLAHYLAAGSAKITAMTARIDGPATLGCFFRIDGEEGRQLSAWFPRLVT